MADSTRDRIIDASIDLFSKKGYAETTIRDIAKKVGIKTSSIYYHFESKDAILDYILTDYMNVVRDNRYRRRWHENKGLIIAGELKTSVEEIMNFMFFKFEDPNNARYRKMVKIICSEAIRNDTVRNYFRDQNNDSFIYIKSMLDFLLVAGEIPKCNTAKLAGVLSSISFAFMHLDSIDMQYISAENEGTDMFSLLEYILKIVMEGSL